MARWSGNARREPTPCVAAGAPCAVAPRSAVYLKVPPDVVEVNAQVRADSGLHACAKLHPAFPGRQAAFEEAHQRVEQISEHADKDDAHDDDIRAQEVRGIQHHLPQADR